MDGSSSWQSDATSELSMASDITRVSVHTSPHETVIKTEYEFSESADPKFCSLDDTIQELNSIGEHSSASSRLMGLISRDEERRSRAAESSSAMNDGESAGSPSIAGEWDRILSDVLHTVSQLEEWDDGDVRATASSSHPGHPFSIHRSRDDATMEGSQEQISPNKGETPTKVKNLRFKLDPDVYDVPSDDSFYDEDDESGNTRPSWRRQQKYRAFSSLDIGTTEPVKLVSVQASVLPCGQKMVARPVGIDLRVRLTQEGQSKRPHIQGASPSQPKRRSPVAEGRWCQELSPVSENIDFRDSVSKETKTVPNGILKSPSSKLSDHAISPTESPNPFKGNNSDKLTNGATHVSPPKKTTYRSRSPLSLSKPAVPKKPDKLLLNGAAWKPAALKLSLPRKKFEPDPEAIERITGYKSAVSKPPLPPPMTLRATSPSSKGVSRADIARKHYLDHKHSAAPKVDSSKKFQQFLTQAQNERSQIGVSVPDLGAIERAVREQWAREKKSVSPRISPSKEDLRSEGHSRGSTPDDAWSSYVQSCRKHLGRRSHSLSYLETNVDLPLPLDEDKWCSSTTLDDSEEQSIPLDDSDLDRSLENLEDSSRTRSEHELRVEKSLQNLNLPDWYKRSDKPKSGFLLGSGAKEKKGWAAAKSLASSTSSLASCGLKRPVRSLRSSRENIPWSRSSSSEGPALSLALTKAFREPYLGWRARTSTSSGVSSSSPRTSPPSTDEEITNGVSFDGEDAYGTPSNEMPKFPRGDDTCDDINNMSMDTCEMFDGASIAPDDVSIVQDEVSVTQADTGDDIDNLLTDTTTGDRLKLSLSEDTVTDEKLRSSQSANSDLRNTTLSSDSPTNRRVHLYPRDNSSTELKLRNSQPTHSSPDRIQKNHQIVNSSPNHQFTNNSRTSPVSDSNHLRNGFESTKPKNILRAGSPSNSRKMATFSLDSRQKDNVSADFKRDGLSTPEHKRRLFKLKRYSYSQSIYNSEWDEEESRGDRKGHAKEDSPSGDNNKVIWIESSFVGSRTTTSIVVLPTESSKKAAENHVERPASR